MHPTHFLALGLDLALKDRSPQTPLSPAYRRSAISRSYYGAHHAVVAAFAKLEWTVSRASYGHDEAQVLLAASGDPILMAASTDLANLYNRRLNADYRLTKPHTETYGYAYSSWEIAMRIQKATEAMLVEPLRTQVETSLAAVATARLIVKCATGEFPRWREFKRDKKKQGQP